MTLKQCTWFDPLTSSWLQTMQSCKFPMRIIYVPDLWAWTKVEVLYQLGVYSFSKYFIHNFAYFTGNDTNLLQIKIFSCEAYHIKKPHSMARNFVSFYSVKNSPHWTDFQIKAAGLKELYILHHVCIFVQQDIFEKMIRGWIWDSCKFGVVLDQCEPTLSSLVTRSWCGQQA